MPDRSPELHPDARDVLADLDLPPRPAQTAAAARDALDAVLIEDEARSIDGVVSDYEIPVENHGVTVRAYRPHGAESMPVVVYYHGGGWVRGNVETHDDLCRRLVDSTGYCVLSVDYRLAPEHPFPAALIDAYAALEWAYEYASLVGGDPTRLVLAGDSAGGNLAAAVALRSRDENGPDIAAQVLLYPITNYAFDTPSYRANAEGYLLTRVGMEWYWEHYLSRPLDGRHPYASPLLARDLDELPPAVVVTAGYDPLRDEGVTYADRLRAAGVPVTHEHYDDMLHAFVSFPQLSQGDAAIETIGRALADRFSDI